MSHASKCILAGSCKVAGSETCNKFCGSYISMMGSSGTGGRVAAAGLPEDYKYLTLDNVPCRESEVEAYKLIDAYAKSFTRQFEHQEDAAKKIKSLYIWSPETGNGKSSTASALLNHWLITHYVGSLQRNRQPLQRPTLFVDVNQLQTDYNGFNRSNVPKDIAEPIAERYYRTIEATKSTMFVVLDDLGVRSSTDGWRGDLHSVVNHRTVNGLPTVMTSNIPMEELSGVFDKRLYDRARDMTVVVRFIGESKRGIRR